MSRHIQEGVLGEAGSSKLLKAALEKLLNDEDGRDKLKRNSAIRVKEFSIESTVEKYQKVYETAMEQHRTLL